MALIRNSAPAFKRGPADFGFFIAHTIEGKDVPKFLAGLIEEVRPTAKLKSQQMPAYRFSGYKGNFVTRVKTGDGSSREISHGVAILPTGAVSISRIMVGACWRQTRIYD